MALCPFAIWRPITRNYGGTMGTIRGLCLHVQEGNNSLWGWFNQPKPPGQEVSAHFWCAKSGALEQYLEPPRQTSWAQGAGNQNYVSVECEGFATEAMTTAQLGTVAALLDWCSSTFNFPVTGPVAHGSSGLTQHCNLNGTPDPAWSNHVCPGPIRLGQEPAIVNLAAGNHTPQQEAPKMLVCFVPGSTKAYFIVKPDGSVWAYGGAVYKGGINWANFPDQPAANALISGDVATDVSVCAADGYLISTAKGGLYAFGSAQFSGKP